MGPRERVQGYLMKLSSALKTNGLFRRAGQPLWMQANVRGEFVTELPSGFAEVYLKQEDVLADDWEVKPIQKKRTPEDKLNLAYKLMAQALAEIYPPKVAK